MLYSRFFSQFIFLFLLIVPLSSSAVTSNIRTHALMLEEDIIAQNTDASYIYLGKKWSNIAEIVLRLSSLDEQQDSPIHQLNAHIRNGFSLAEYNAVVEALEYAANMIEKQSKKIARDQLNQLNDSLDQLAWEIERGNLTIDKNRDHRTLLCYEAQLHDVTFEENVTFEEDVTIEGTLTVSDLVVTNCIQNLCVDNLVVNSCMDGLCVNDLSVTNAFLGTAEIGCDLTVGCNINMHDSANSAVGNIIKDGSSFIHNYPAGAFNTFVGENSGNFTMTGTQNSVLGASSLANNTTGNLNVAVGAMVLSSNTIGFQNIAVGVFAMGANVSGTNNVAVGTSALQSNTIGSYNTALGDFALAANIDGAANTAVGQFAMGSNTTASNNTAVGQAALSSSTIGTDNTAVGNSAMFSNVTGDQNTAVGSNALVFATGTNNIALGHQAGFFATTGSNDIYIGSLGSAAESAAIRIGTLGTHTTCFIQGIDAATTGLPAISVLIDGNGQLGTISSSERFKHNIVDMGDASSNILNLRPVTFAYNSDATETTQYGLIAEEVNQVFPAIVVKDAGGQPYTIQYHVLPVLLLNELIKQKAEFASAMEAINNRLVALEQQN